MVRSPRQSADIAPWLRPSPWSGIPFLQVLRHHSRSRNLESYVRGWTFIGPPGPFSTQSTTSLSIASDDPLSLAEKTLQEKVHTSALLYFIRGLLF
jgi:hypothetical protein